MGLIASDKHSNLHRNEGFTSHDHENKRASASSSSPRLVTFFETPFNRERSPRVGEKSYIGFGAHPNLTKWWTERQNRCQLEEREKMMMKIGTFLCSCSIISIFVFSLTVKIFFRELFPQFSISKTLNLHKFHQLSDQTDRNQSNCKRIIEKKRWVVKGKLKTQLVRVLMLCCRSHLRTVYKFFNSSVRKALEMVRVINKLWKLSGRKYRLSLSIHSNLLNIKCNLISVNIRIFYFPSVQCNKHRPSINESENRKRKKIAL